MPTSTQISIDNRIDPASNDLALRELELGLGETPRRIPTRFLYDELGSQLFEKITDLEEYYLTRAERALLERHADEIQQITGCNELVELGAGSATKTRLLLDAMQAAGQLGLYIPFDVSETEVRRVAEELVEEYPGLQVHGIVADFMHHLGAIPSGGNRLVMLLGSTIGNFSHDGAVGFLSRISSQMQGCDHFLLGVDLIKEVARIEAAYNDRSGITAHFNRNILRVVNRAADADFDVDSFSHRARYNRDFDRMELFLVADRAMTVRLDAIDTTVDLDRGEAVLTEISSKYSREMADSMLEQSGLCTAGWYEHPEGLFALALARTSAAS